MVAEVVHFLLAFANNTMHPERELCIQIAIVLGRFPIATVSARLDDESRGASPNDPNGREHSWKIDAPEMRSGDIGPRGIEMKLSDRLRSHRRDTCNWSLKYGRPPAAGVNYLRLAERPVQ